MLPSLWSVLHILLEGPFAAPPGDARVRRTARLHKRRSHDEGSLDQYLRDISAYPLITREEEVVLAQRIRLNDQ